MPFTDWQQGDDDFCKRGHNQRVLGMFISSTGRYRWCAACERVRHEARLKRSEVLRQERASLGSRPRGRPKSTPTLAPSNLNEINLLRRWFGYDAQTKAQGSGEAAEQTETAGRNGSTSLRGVT